MSTTAASTAPAAPTPTGGNNGGGGGGGGPTSSPLLFFVALGFGVVFTNLWIIVGVKYCFRYNQRNRAARALNENGDPIGLGQMPHPRRRRREKKLMSMEEVNERFPLTKYKIWRSSREAQGLPTEGGVTATPSRAGSVKGAEVALTKHSTETARPETVQSQTEQPQTQAHTALDMARQDHVNSIEGAPRPVSTDKPEKTLDKENLEHLEDASRRISVDRSSSVATDLDDDDDDPIRTAAPPEMLAAPGDTCAICLDTLEDDDDVRGLTCGHAFHGSCVDPWLTSRRACCPLCKADYYVPKPRAEGDDPRNAPLPQQPPSAWIGSRAGFSFRPRMLLGPRFFGNGGDRADPHPPSSSWDRDRMRRAQESYQPSLPQQDQAPDRSWRSRFPVMQSSWASRFGRRQPEQTPQPPTITASDLEAGTRH